MSLGVKVIVKENNNLEDSLGVNAYALKSYMLQGINPQYAAENHR